MIIFAGPSCEELHTMYDGFTTSLNFLNTDWIIWPVTHSSETVCVIQNFDRHPEILPQGFLKQNKNFESKLMLVTYNSVYRTRVPN